MNTWQNSPIIRRADGSYVIAYAGYPEYHVPNKDEFIALWSEIDAYAQAHPEQVLDEPAPPQPTETELLERAKALKTTEFDLAMSEIDAKLARSSSDIVAAMLSTATTEETGTASPSADELAQSKAVFVSLRSMQAQNRALRTQVQDAQSVEEVQAVTPLLPDMNTVTPEPAN